MSVRWRADCEKWEASVTINGKRIRERFDKRKDADSRDVELRRLRTDSIGMSGMNKPYSTTEAFANYLETESAQKTPKTRRADITFIALAKKFFEPRNLLRDVTLEDLQRFQIQCSEVQHWSATTIALRMKILKAIFKKATATGRIPRDPTLYWKVPRGTGRRRRPMTGEEFRKLLEVDKGSWLTPVLLFIRLTGSRGASVASLRWCDVDFSKAELLLRSRKGGVGMEKTILFPMFEELFQLLARERNKNPNASPDEYVFRDGSLRSVTGHRISSAGHRLIKEAGLEGVVIYSLRHALAVDLTERGVNLEIVRQLMGHSNISQTQEYAKGIGTETLRDSMRLIRGSIAGTKPDNSED